MSYQKRDSLKILYVNNFVFFNCILINIIVKPDFLNARRSNFTKNIQVRAKMAQIEKVDLS